MKSQKTGDKGTTKQQETHRTTTTARKRNHFWIDRVARSARRSQSLNIPPLSKKPSEEEHIVHMRYLHYGACYKGGKTHWGHENRG